MSRKNKIDPAEKVKTIERVLADEISATEAAQLIHSSTDGIQSLIIFHCPLDG